MGHSNATRRLGAIILSRAESKFCTPNGGTCTSKTIGLLVRRHIVAGEFHYIGFCALNSGNPQTHSPIRLKPSSIRLARAGKIMPPSNGTDMKKGHVVLDSPACASDSEL
jgi:hypothetical protein